VVAPVATTVGMLSAARLLSRVAPRRGLWGVLAVGGALLVGAIPGATRQVNEILREAAPTQKALWDAYEVLASLRRTLPSDAYVTVHCGPSLLGRHGFRHGHVTRPQLAADTPPGWPGRAWYGAVVSEEEAGQAWERLLEVQALRVYRLKRPPDIPERCLRGIEPEPGTMGWSWRGPTHLDGEPIRDPLDPRPVPGCPRSTAAPW